MTSQRETDARTNVVLIARLVCCLRQRCVNQNRWRELFVFPPHTQVIASAVESCASRPGRTKHSPWSSPQSEADQNLARSCWCSTYRRVRDADRACLVAHVTPPVPSTIRRSEIRIIDDEVVDVVIGVRSATGKQVVVDVPDLIDVHAEFDGVTSGGSRSSYRRTEIVFRPAGRGDPTTSLCQT